MVLGTTGACVSEGSTPKQQVVEGRLLVSQRSDEPLFTVVKNFIYGFAELFPRCKFCTRQL